MNALTQMLGVLLVFVLIVSTAMVNVILFLMLTSYLLSGNYASKWQLIWTSSVARVSLLLFGLFLLGILYTSASFSEVRATLSSYRELWLIPIVISIFNQAQWQQRAYYAFLVIIAIAVLASFSMRLGWLPPGKPNEDWVPFKGRIAFGFFLAFAIYLMIHHTMQAKTLRKRLCWGAFAALSTFDLLFLISGRTGHVVFIVLIALLLFQYRVQARKYWLALFIALSVFATITVLTSPSIKSRLVDIERAVTHPETSDIGLRLIFWKTSVRIIAEHPLFGAGTGSFTRESLMHEIDHPKTSGNNPHNEYLMIASQLGLVGLSVFIWLLYRMYAESKKIQQPYHYASQGLVVAMAVGCIFNSFLRDHAEGHFFAIYLAMLFSSITPKKAAV